jgi:hypothetical protein
MITQRYQQWVCDTLDEAYAKAEAHRKAGHQGVRVKETDAGPVVSWWEESTD